MPKEPGKVAADLEERVGGRDPRIPAPVVEAKGIARAERGRMFEIDEELEPGDFGEHPAAQETCGVAEGHRVSAGVGAGEGTGDAICGGDVHHVSPPCRSRQGLTGFLP